MISWSVLCWRKPIRDDVQAWVMKDPDLTGSNSLRTNEEIEQYIISEKLAGA